MPSFASTFATPKLAAVALERYLACLSKPYGVNLTAPILSLFRPLSPSVYGNYKVERSPGFEVEACRVMALGVSAVIETAV